jgi:hypothetical protein
MLSTNGKLFELDYDRVREAVLWTPFHRIVILSGAAFISGAKDLLLLHCV